MIILNELIGQPDPKMYTRALELMQLAPSEAMMVASHAYDLRAAKKVYVQHYLN